MATINKSDFISRIAASAGTSHEAALTVVNAALEEVQVAIEAGDKVTLMDFGTFEGRERAARVGRNPHTGEELTIAARTAPVFKAAKNFQKRVADAATKHAS